MTIPVAAAIVNVEGERSVAAAQIHKTKPRKSPDYNMEEDEPAKEHLPGIVGLTVDHAGLVSVHTHYSAEMTVLGCVNSSPRRQGARTHDRVT